MATRVYTKPRYEPTKEDKKQAQEYAENYLNGGMGYVSPGEVPNAMLNAQTPINKVVHSSSSGGASGGAYDAYAGAIAEQNRILREQQEIQRRQREAAMNATIQANNSAADKSLNEAYIANMTSKKNLPQQLKAFGISGGGAETTLNDISNTYMNNRTAIESGRNDANSNARYAYDQGVNGDYGNYLAKAYNLQGSLSDKMVKKSANPVQTTGYQIGNNSTVHKGANEQSTRISILEELRAMGLSEAQSKEYLRKLGMY